MYKTMFISRAFQRSLHTTPATFIRRKANPGIGIQTQVFQKEGIIPGKDFEDFEDLETDFMNIHKTHKDYEREIEKQREKIRLWVVKNKYFKEKLPNFLTYTEKEQIKLLHSKDPEEWTIEKLEECFPANAEVIQKVIKTKWVPKSAKRIKAHDEAVMKNWQSFQNNEFIQLNKNFKEHLMKFASRKKEDLENISTNLDPRPPLPRPRRTDFLSLITSCKGYEDKEPTRIMITDTKAKGTVPTTLPSADDEETYISDRVKDKRTMRLEDLKALKPQDVTTKEGYIDNPGGTGIITTNFSTMEKYASDEIVVSKNDMIKYEMTKVKDKIYIPKKLRKKGATYKVEDCYYDDDGEFLYRVPGMMGH